ncbi:MAG: HAMP domain-containing histidine kinase [Ktedonobacteraceae bacterium]|nr:HAMP domain-containing histidine kinase [Ktedonobacteraceae bacterium]
MRYFNTLSVRFLKLPRIVRICIVVLCFVVCFISYLFSQYNGPLLALPLAVAAWLFKQRGTFIGTGFIAVAMAIAISVNNHSIFWPSPLLTGFITGMIALLTEGIFIHYLRYLLDTAEAARQQAAQAEQQRLIAYEQQVAALQAEQRMSDAYERQRQLNQLKDQFILNVNHELRSPLMALGGWLEVLNLYGEQFDRGVQANYLSKALESYETIMLLLNNVLDVAQVDGEKPLQMEICQIVEVVNEELAGFDRREVQGFAIQLDIPAHLTVLANRQYLRRVLCNLLSNAFKYAPRHTCIIIGATREDSDGQVSGVFPRICISVTDAGPGIPPAEQAFLFEKFVRLKRDVATSVRGCGLGLYISKQLVEAMGGHMWVESSGRGGEGSRFCFTLSGSGDTKAAVEPCYT